MTEQGQFSEQRAEAQSLHIMAAKLGKERAINQSIAAADPLAADEIIRQLPLLNEQQNILSIIEALQLSINNSLNMRYIDYIQCSAAIRDISILGASLARFKLEPTEHIHNFDTALCHLSRQARTRMPRDSFIDYTSRNPEGVRERSFTNLEEERIFIQSLRQGMEAMDNCLHSLLYTAMHTLSEIPFAEHCAVAADHFQKTIAAIVRVRRGIHPEIFTDFIRPFFEPFCVNHCAYSAPSGAEMPILNIDHILWGTDCQDDLYLAYFYANISRLPPIYQEIAQAFTGQPALLTKVQTRLAEHKPLNAQEQGSIQTLHRLLTLMYSFRMPHYKVALDNVTLRLRERHSCAEVKGSSGFGLAEVKLVLDKTVECRKITTQALASHAK
jgi:hypothetical protein